MIAFRGFNRKITTTRRILLVLVFLVTTMHVEGTHTASASTTRYWEHQTIQAGIPPLWMIQQTVRFAIRYNDRGYARKLTYIDAWCPANSIGITLNVTWCGGSRQSDREYIVGFNFTKSAFWIIATQTCYARVHVRAQGRYNGAFPALYVYDDHVWC